MAVTSSSTNLCKGRCGTVRPCHDFYSHSNGRLFGKCKECYNADLRDKYLADPTTKRASNKRWAVKNKAQMRTTSRDHYLKHREEISLRHKEWKRNNATKSTTYTLKWAKANPAKIAAASSRRRSHLKQRMPRWLTETHLIDIQGFYDRASKLSRISTDKFHVDHIVPLQGKDVCGLHVPWNLQVILGRENSSKGNRMTSNG